jgi:hypothetical protein
MYTTDELISGIKRRASIPTANATFQAVDFLALADDEIRSVLLPRILSARESYYSFSIDEALSLTDATYGIPTRAIGAKLDGIYAVNSTTGQKLNLILVQEEEVSDPTVSPVGEASFYFKGNSVVVVPLPLGANFDTLRMSIFIRPSALAATSDCARVTGIAGAIVTCSSVPTTFTTSTLLDCLNGVPHYDFRAIDQLPTAVTTGTAGTVTFSSLPSGLVIGDWLSLSESSPVVQIPVEFQPVLEQRVANACLRAQGMGQQLQAGEAALKAMEETFLLINPRAEREQKKIRNTSGLLRRNSWGW